MNDSVFYFVDNLHAAIADDKKITFRYFNYNLQKEKEYNKKSYIASPFALLWSDGNYYLMAFEDSKMKHFRVDRMDNVKLSDEKRDGKGEYRTINLSERSPKVFSMYGGKEERVTLRFNRRMIGVVIDRFGRDDIMMIPDGDKHFTLTVDVEISPQFFGWLCGLGKNVKIMSSEIAEQMKKHIDDIAEMYAPDKEA
jgi:predicted DNA-binding transcriptional regulator YafY